MDWGLKALIIMSLISSKLKLAFLMLALVLYVETCVCMYMLCS